MEYQHREEVKRHYEQVLRAKFVAELLLEAYCAELPEKEGQVPTQDMVELQRCIKATILGIIRLSNKLIEIDSCRDRFNNKLTEFTLVDIIKSRYTIKRTGDIIILKDLDGPKSLTNDMENVIDANLKIHPDILNCVVIYCDTTGRWDRVIINSLHPAVIDFCPIKMNEIIESESRAIQCAKMLFRKEI